MGFGGGAFGTGSYTYSVIDDETIKLNQQKGVIYANSTISDIQNGTTQNGAISGTITYSEPATGKYYKKFLAVLSNFQNQNQNSNFLSNSGTSGIGEAPQLSSTYAQYDNGASVFTNYWNFAGTTLPSGWTQSNGGVASWSVNNGLTVSKPSSGYQNVYYTTQQTLSSTGIVFDLYGSYSTSSLNTGFGMPYLNGVNQGNSAWISYDGSSGKFTNHVFNGGTGNDVDTPITFSTAKQVWTFYSIGSGIVLLNNYGNATTNNNEFSTLTAYMGVNQNANATATMFIQWWRTRAVPPNGVMPSVSFGSFTSSSGASITIPSGIDYYMPITITNSQSSATPSPFQQMIQININNYSDYMYFDGNIANFEFFTSTGTIIPAWIESNNNGTLTIWVKLSSGIGANSSITIYLGVAITVYQYSINYPVPFTTEANIIYNSGINASTTLSTLTISLTALQQATGTIIVEGY